ncbi:Leukocyte elastase inhibitor C [Toxocara canis]|uniref:Leukocyte elastase inhibitor C n=1 Tax=Toxocara canis TaxID=6265 RepID=A0A0B2UMT4_TOXCA|nr:Leukocyte elastase inhibitor C [Toxocara canis]
MAPNFAASFSNVALSLSFVILSPFSVSIALAMAYAGADGKTKIRIRNTLAKGATDEELINYFSTLMADMSKPANGYKLLAANKLYLQENFDPLQSFIDVINNKFGGQIQKVDFSKAFETAKIKNIICADILYAATSLALVNAVYFKGDWATKFDAKLTAKKQFHLTENSDREVEMMKVTHHFPYTEDETVQVLGLPYKNGDVFIYVFLPKKRFGLAEVERSIDGEKMLQLINFCEKDNKIIVELPKFKLKSKFELKTTLEQLGIRDAFTSHANFSALSKRDLSISNVVHQAFIETNEEGTEAAAATALLMYRSMRPSASASPIQFIADHPFVFAVVKDGNILFIGRVH